MSLSLTLGIDIGTTNIGFCVYDEKNARQIDTYSIPNGCDIKGKDPFERLQDADKIMDKVQKELTSLTEKYNSLQAIGLSCQMHGILYLNKDGFCVSPLYTWQDERGNEHYENGLSYADYVTKISGIDCRSGYGLVTHFYNLKNQLVPKDASTLCSIGDYAAMKLCGLNTPLVHTSVGASFGLFDTKKLCFDAASAKKLGISSEFLPKITRESTFAGAYKNIPVCVCLGDNQASFLGSVEEEGGILVNYGTGSQISFASQYRESTESTELRPYLDGKYLVCGAALCGGRAYAILENFFKDYMTHAGMSADSQYETLNGLALEELEKNDGCLPIFNTRFCGTRISPDETAFISNLTDKNFTASKLIASLLYGMANELYEMYTETGNPAFSKLYASGGAVRKNKALQIVLNKVFGKEPVLPDIKEEAAYGGAKFAFICLERSKRL